MVDFADLKQAVMGQITMPAAWQGAFHAHCNIGTCMRLRRSRERLETRLVIVPWLDHFVSMMHELAGSQYVCPVHCPAECHSASCLQWAFMAAFAL